MVVYLLCQVPFHSFHLFNRLDPRWTFGGGLGWLGVCVQYTLTITLERWWKYLTSGAVLMLPPIGGKIDSGKFLFAPSSFFCKNHSSSLGLSLCVPYKQKRKRKRTCKGTQAHAREHSPNTLSRHPLMLMSKANAPGPCTSNVYQCLTHLDTWETWILGCFWNIDPDPAPLPTKSKIF